MNLKIKFRESFRPFAPAVVREKVAEYFELETDSPYMLLVAPVRESQRTKIGDEDKNLRGIEKLKTPRSTIPAVTHVDYTARVQTVEPETNRMFYDLLEKFGALTGHPVLINTSFNVRGEPIVCTPAEAFACFTRTEMDYLVVEDFLLDKKAQREELKIAARDWQKEFPLD